MKLERDKLDSEKEIILQDMKIKDTLIEKLNKQIKDSNEKLSIFESSMPQSEKEYKIKILNYEKNIDTLSTMYLSLTS